MAMFRKQECVAMLLAGGQGSRLYPLTQNIAKPAVPYGGKYRIIDFPLSNCANSGLETVGVLTQYQPLVLNDYVGSGAPWDLDRMDAGVHVLSPYQQQKGSEWYSGTANAIYQNLNFIKRYNPEYVLVLSGDHIYKMDYSKMIAYHKENNADCTIAVIEVEMEEASRFGILNTNNDNSIYEFDEKPEVPKNNLASMGIYVFNFDALCHYLELDEKDKNSQNDFGRNVLPAMLDDDRRMFAYRFNGYWKDVGTLDSLWEANMDLLNPKIPLDLSDADWRIYARNLGMPPHFIGKTATVQNSMISEGGNVDGSVDFSVVFSGVTISEGAQVRDSILMPGVKVMPGAKIEYAIIGENTIVGENTVVGGRPEKIKDKEKWGIAVVADNIKIGKNCVIKPKGIIEKNMQDGEGADE